MGAYRKLVRGDKRTSHERVIGKKVSYDTARPAWMFDMIDKDGPFAFNVGRTDFDDFAAHARDFSHELAA